MKANENGSVSLMGILLLLALLSYALLNIHLKLESLERSRERARTYLCAKNYIETTQSYISDMAIINGTLSVISKLRLIPKLTVIAQNMHRMALYAQQLRHLSHLKKLTSLPYCPSQLTAYWLTTLPYKTRLSAVLARDFEGMAVPQGKLWSVYIPSSFNPRTAFAIALELSLDGQYSRKALIKTKEWDAEALLNSKLPFGSLLWRLFSSFS